MAGLVAGGAVAWLVASDPGAGRGAAGTLRGDLDVLDASRRELDLRVVSLAARCNVMAERLEAVLRAADAQSPQTVPELPIKTLADDVRALRDATQRELAAVEARLTDLRKRIDDALAAPAAHQGPLTPDEEERWSALTRDADPGTRFSALVFLGRARTDRSVQSSLERLTTDDDPEVLCQAIRNLAHFREKPAAPQVAEKLDHKEPIVRAAARDALVAMGAPKDNGFDPIAPDDRRRAAAESLRRWAESQ